MLITKDASLLLLQLRGNCIFLALHLAFTSKLKIILLCPTAFGNGLAEKVLARHGIVLW